MPYPGSIPASSGEALSIPHCARSVKQAKDLLSLGRCTLTSLEAPDHGGELLLLFLPHVHELQPGVIDEF